MVQLPGDVGLLKHGVENGYFSKPRVHPNGFIQIDSLKDADVRMHYWHPALRIRQKTYSPIHSHSFSFISKVFRGRMFNMEYDLEATLRPTHEVWTCYADGENNSVLRPDEKKEPIEICSTHCESILPGEDYIVRMGAFHETAVSIPTITMMRKTQKSKIIRPKVLVPVGQEPDNDYRRDDVDLGYLYQIIKECYA